MASPQESVSMALFCDFENVALGVRDANYEKFDIKRVLERLLLKGSIVVKKAYCDWERYKGFKAVMHEANFELIEIPHVRQSGKNSADIRLVVDALDLCYTKSHVNTFVIISGDSDFSPLVSKLRENAKQVIGVGVKQSTSDLLIANCDEFIFYDDLVREDQRKSKRAQRDAQPQARRSPDEETQRRDELEARRTKAVEIAVETFEALLEERGDSGKIWSSVLKEAIKRRKPDFNESYFGFRAFGNLLEEAQSRGLLAIARDEKSNTYVYRSRETLPAGGGESDDFESDAEVAAGSGTPAQASGPAPGAEADKPTKARGRRKGGRKDEAGKKERAREGGAGQEESGTDATRAGGEGRADEGRAAPAETPAPAAAPPRAEAPAPEVPATQTATAAEREPRPSAAERAPAVDDAAAAEVPAASDKPARKRTPRKKKVEGEAAGALASAAGQPAEVEKLETRPSQRARAAVEQDSAPDAMVEAQQTTESPEAESGAAKPARKSTARARRPRNKEAADDTGKPAKDD